MQLTAELVPLTTHHPFIIARGGSAAWQTVWVRLTDRDGTEGWGEAAPSRFYGETAATVLAALEVYREVLAATDSWSLEAREAALVQALRGNPSARVAVSAALHDIHAKRLGAPLWQVWGLAPSAAPRSSFTIGIAPLDVVRQRVLEAAQYPILKVKLGSAYDEALIRTVREAAPDKTLRIDANCAWTPKRALAMIPLLAELGVEFVEQPLPPEDIEGLRFVRERSSLPIIADESCLVAADIPKLLGAVDGINLKLAKCGSLLEARRIIHVARAHSLRVMAGCMIESSLGITAAAHLAPLLDDADLDGAALVSNDPFVGATIAGGVVALPEAPGLGVSRRGG
jgi:L-alanine-DL-glutamate epimerase-like enolase superfamily enzyme